MTKRVIFKPHPALSLTPDLTFMPKNSHLEDRLAPEPNSSQNGFREPDLVSMHQTLFVPKVSQQWVNENAPFSLDQPWPYDFPETESSYGIAK